MLPSEAQKNKHINYDTNLSGPRCDSIPITRLIRDWGTTTSQALSKMDIITSYHYINTWGIQQFIQVTRIQQHQYKASDYGCKHEKHNDIHLLSQAADPEPIPRLKKKKKELQYKGHRSRVKTSETCTCNCCCSICEPRGLSNPITMGNKTIKA